MALIKNVNHLASVLLDVLRGLGKGTAWLALFVYTAILALVLIAHYLYLNPVFYGPVKTFTALISPDMSDRFYHYPSHFLYLPWFFGWAKLAVSVLLEGIFLGTAALAFWQMFHEGKSAESSFVRALKRWPQFILVSIIFNGLVIAANFFLPQMFQGMLADSPRRQLVFEFGVLPAVYCVLLALFFVAIPAVAVRGESFIRAIARSFRLAVRRPFSLLVLSFIVLIVPLLLSAMANKPDVIIEKFHPELVFLLLLVGLFAEMIANYIWICAAVRFLADEED